jgi:hypothetical protein
VSVRSSWIGFAPAQATVICGGETHRLRWEAGALSALDHHDAQAERTLAALGGQRCACVDSLDAWTRRAGDLRVLLLASRGLGDTVVRQPPTPGRSLRPPRAPGNRAATVTLSGGVSVRHSQATSTRSALAVPRPGRADPDEDLLSLLDLGGGLPERLVATVAETWRTRLEQPGPEAGSGLPQLQAALYGRTTAALRSWLGEGELAVEVTMIDAGEPRRLLAQAGGIRAELPFAWLGEVWCRGLATVWGRFCIDASSEDGQHWTLTTVGPDLGPIQSMTIDLAPVVVVP